jgi:hypothetical protein
MDGDRPGSPAPFGAPPGGPAPAYASPGTPGGSYGPGPAPGAGWDSSDDAEQAKFDSFKREEPPSESASEPPPPQVRNGRVLLLVLTAAVLLLAIPLGTLWALGKMGGESESSGYVPRVGVCVKNSNNRPVPADCGEDGVFKVVSKVDDASKCEDPTQPTIALPGDKKEVLCLKPAADAD